MKFTFVSPFFSHNLISPFFVIEDPFSFLGVKKRFNLIIEEKAILLLTFFWPLLLLHKKDFSCRRNPNVLRDGFSRQACYVYPHFGHWREQ